MNRKFEPDKNPIGPQVFFNVLLVVLLLASMGVGYVWMNMRNKGRVGEAKKLEASIALLEQEIELIKVDLDKLQEPGRLAALMHEKGLELVKIQPGEPVVLAQPSLLKNAP